ncbi:sodium/calcium exchanger regulatory protein 1-like [Patiria miniata]|uniref:Lipocalin/cytosolic fatty-acid binding domain-containing protein n=1 Tax=Patiria miniata TaxID=46514 RepID=A0A914BEB2_PATMI|nr:sodium/calcium exchanger regulatory protein 1-like [Patiria miniata]
MAEAEASEPVTSEPPTEGEAKTEEPTVTDPLSSSEPEAASDPQPGPTGTENTTAASDPQPGPTTTSTEDTAAASEPLPGPTGDEHTAAASDTPPVPTAENAAAGNADSPADLAGTWHLARNEHFDEFLKASGIGFMKRKVITALHPTIEIKQEGEVFTFTSKTPMGNRVTSFTVGVEYPETNPLWGDKEHRVMPEWQGAKLVQKVVHGPDDKLDRSFEREIVDGELVITMRRGDKSCKRIFKKKDV